jgi:hypothetical protein
MKIRILFSAIIATFISSAALQAANQWWNATTDANWDYSTTNWYDWNPDQSHFSAGDSAIFEYNVARTVTITSSVTVSGLTFSLSGFNITGGPLSVTANPYNDFVLDIRNGVTATISSYFNASAITDAVYTPNSGGNVIFAGGGDFGARFQDQAANSTFSLVSGIYNTQKIELTPGWTTGNTGTFRFTINAGIVGGGTQLNVSNQMFVVGENLDIATIGTLTAGDYIIASYGSLIGGFASVTLNGAALPDGYTLNTAYNGGTQIALQVASVPEPSTWVTLLGGLGMLAMFRRRRA